MFAVLKMTKNAPLVMNISMGNAADFFPSYYENILMTRKFNAQDADSSVKDNCNIYSFGHLIIQPTYDKNPMNPKHIHPPDA